MSKHWVAKSITILSLLFTIYKAATAYPSQCSLQGNSNFICNKGGLTKIPPDIPKSAYRIDLSNNVMLKFEDDHFLRFHDLKELLLNNCALKHAVLLPKSLRVIQLKDNALSEEAVRKTFENDHDNITTIKLANNRLLLEQVLEVIPRNTVRLQLDGNNFPEVRPNHFLGFRNLMHLSIRSCNITNIAPRSFDSLIRIRELRVEKNNIQSLPDDLFLKNKRMREIRLNDNKFTKMPNLKGPLLFLKLFIDNNYIVKISKNDFHQRISDLSIAKNKVESVDLRHVQILSLDLSFNRIKRLNDFAFGGIKRFLELKLQNNNISYISPLAFMGVTSIGSLYLHKNAIELLPRNVFRNMDIATLFLYGNKIQTMNGILNEMRETPSTLLLFSNPQLKVFNVSDFVRMRRQSILFLNCSNLVQISGHMGLPVDVHCFPGANFTIQSNDRLMERDGFECVRSTPGIQVTCSPCPFGTYVSGEPCQKCPPGSFYQDEFGLNYCKNCPSGQYVPPDKSPGKSPLDCLTCPDGTQKNVSAGYRACSCIDGFARKDRFGKCTKCSETGISCKQDYPMLKHGYWWTWHHGSPSDRRCKQSFKDFIGNLEIKDDSYIRKSSSYDCNLPQPHKCPVGSACLGGVEASCLPNYKGVLCSSCQTGYSRNWQECIKCPTPVIAGFQFVGYIVLFFVVCALISLADKIQLSEDDGQQRTFADVTLSNIKILLGFYQVLASIMHAFSFISWPNSLRKAIGIIQFVQLQVFRVPSLSCINPDWGLNVVHEFWIALMGTAAVPVIILAYYTIKKGYLERSLALHQSFTKESEKCKKNCLRVLMLFLFVTYPLTSQRVVQILPISCHEICTVMGKGNCLHQISYLRADYSVKCLSTNDLTLFFAYAAIIVPLGFPVIILSLLLKYAMKTTGKSDELQGDLLLHPDRTVEETSLQFAIKFLHENYTSENCYWEALEMLRKMVMTVGVTLFIGYYKMGIGITIVVAGGFAIAHAYRRPMRSKFENMVQLFSLSIIPVNLCLGVVLKWNRNAEAGAPKDDTENVKLGVFLVSLNMIVFLLIACRVLKDLGRVMRRCCLKSRGGVCCLPCCPCRKQRVYEEDSGGSEDGYIEFN